MRSALLAIPLSLLTGCGAATMEPDPPPLGQAARGGSLVIDRGRAIAWAADADNHAIHRVDLVSMAVTTTAVEGAPEQLLVVGDRLAAALRDRNEVALFDVTADGDATPAASARVPCDPFGLALTPQGEILVTSAYCHAVTALDRATLEERWSVDVAREPRGVVSAIDGARAYVTHLVGDAITAIDLDGAPTARRVRALGAAYRNRVDQAIGAGTLHGSSALAFGLALSDEGDRLFVPHLAEENGSSTTRTLPGMYGGVPVEEETSFASVAVIATKGERALGDGLAGAPRATLAKAAFIAPDPSIGFAVAPEPARARQARAAAILGDRLYVASQGTGELFELDARAIDPAMSPKRRFSIGEGPKGVDVDGALGVAVAWSQISHEIAIVSLGSGAVDRRVIAGDPLPRAVAAGRRLFTTELDRRVSRDGRACASCHPEGRDDGLVWKLGAGPRQTPTLVGRLGRGPYAWQAKHTRLQDNMRETMTRLGGSGLSDRDLDDLAAYVQQGLTAPARENKALTRVEKRGRDLFTSEKVGCSGCHAVETDYSDRSLHDVGSKARADVATTFRTPPLLWVGATAPYFHDGRYATLEELLDDNLDRMGQTSHLSRDDLRAIAAFLRTL